MDDSTKSYVRFVGFRYGGSWYDAPIDPDEPQPCVRLTISESEWPRLEATRFDMWMDWEQLGELIATCTEAREILRKNGFVPPEEEM